MCYSTSRSFNSDGISLYSWVSSLLYRRVGLESLKVMILAYCRTITGLRSLGAMTKSIAWYALANHPEKQKTKMHFWLLSNPLVQICWLNHFSEKNQDSQSDCVCAVGCSTGSVTDLFNWGEGLQSNLLCVAESLHFFPVNCLTSRFVNGSNKDWASLCRTLMRLITLTPSPRVQAIATITTEDCCAITFSRLQKLLQNC